MSIAKTIGQLIGSLIALPHLLLYGCAIPLLGKPRAFSGASERIAKIPGLLGVYARQAFYRCTLQHVGKNVYFGFMSVFSKPATSLGDHVYIGRFCSIGWADIGPNTMLADHVQILSGRHQHGSNSPSSDTSPDIAPPLTMQDQPQSFSQVTIGSGVWLGAGSIIMADVGQHALVAAGAVVVKPVPANTKVAGVPAKPLLS